MGWGAEAVLGGARRPVWGVTASASGRGTGEDCGGREGGGEDGSQQWCELSPDPGPAAQAEWDESSGFSQPHACSVPTAPNPVLFRPYCLAWSPMVFCQPRLQCLAQGWTHDPRQAGENHPQGLCSNHCLVSYVG
jgi:hypothetical protein